MRRFDTVLFDLDGTLLDTLEDICGAANHTLRELGYPERTLAEMRRFVGNGAEMQMRRALGADADEETVAKALALYKPYYAAHCQIKTKPYAGVLELMAALKAEGFRLAGGVQQAGRGGASAGRGALRRACRHLHGRDGRSAAASPRPTW